MKKILMILTISVVFTVLLMVQAFAGPPAPCGRPLKVGIIVPASATDHGWNQQGVDGLKALKGKWDLTIEIAENQGYTNIKPALRDFARKGYDLIIAHASGYQTVAPEIAKEDNIRVAVVEYPGAIRKGLISNYEGKGQEGAFIAGVLAAKMTRSKIVGVVTSAEVPDWNRMTVGFMEGVHYVNPRIRLLYNVIGEAAYEDAAGGKRNTETQIAFGADVIFGMGDGASFGIMNACEEHKARDGGKVWFIDVIGSKQSIDKNGILLGSVLWNFDVVYERMLIDIYNGTFGKNYYQTLENGGIEMKLYKTIPESALIAVQKAKNDVINGRIRVSDIPSTAKMRAMMRKLFRR